MNVIALMKALPGSVAQGLIWGLLAMGVYITYKVLDYADLTVDGSLCTGGAVAVMMMLAGYHPFLALVGATIAGMLAGLVTGVFHVTFGIPAILSGILTQLGLYSVNMRIMGKSNQAISVDKYNLLLSLRNIPKAIFVASISCVIVIVILYWFFGTELGRSIRATGNNENMSRAQGINTKTMKIIGLMLSNGLVGLSGALYAQYQGNADVNMGRGAIVIGLAAVIIGGVLFGKLFHNFAFRLVGVVFGAILYFVVITIVLQLGLETTDLKLVSALIVAVFLAVPYLRGQYYTKHGKKRREGKCLN
ncbi:autoinducer 2 import system permease protein LsrC [Anaerotignum neopropionicum]|uniref:Autoinducer 2 import system permease protein LsrC n=1 Tax=Anaerotignum neopropionicum TaxID=36847 RepID=A0A136WJF4_9FIRM|nr:ABC transporter permease [Anaerotignum neopropionicum]KXL54479.1 autoinducer 2 import system permease protein LsrC [Anaerotignum neopropionicum]